MNYCLFCTSERLKLVPAVLESLMSEKRLLHAAILLVRSLKTANSQDMMDVGAVADLRSYLIGQETVSLYFPAVKLYPHVQFIQALREILIDELHSHLYLKSFWCDSRWAAYTPNQQCSMSISFAIIHKIAKQYTIVSIQCPTWNSSTGH